MFFLLGRYIPDSDEKALVKVEGERIPVVSKHRWDAFMVRK